MEVTRECLFIVGFDNCSVMDAISFQVGEGKDPFPKRASKEGNEIVGHAEIVRVTPECSVLRSNESCVHTLKENFKAGDD